MNAEFNEFTEDEARFRLNACLRKMLGRELTPEEWEVIRDVNRRNGWDRPASVDTHAQRRDAKQGRRGRVGSAVPERQTPEPGSRGPDNG